MKAIRRAKSLITEGGSELESLRFLLFLCLLFALPFEMYWSSFFFALLAVLTVASITRSKLRSVPPQFWIFQAVFFLGLAGYAYSLHRDAAGFLLERQLSIALVPLLLPMAFRLSEGRYHLCMWTVVLSCLISAVVLFANVLNVVVFEIRQPLSVIFSGPFFNHQFSRPLNIHAGYLSLFMAISIFFVLEQSSLRRGQKRAAYLVMVLFLFVTLLFLAARNTIIASAAICIFLYPFFTQARWRFMMAGLGLAAAFLITAYSVPYLRQRFTSELLSDITPVQIGQRQALYGGEPRIQRWQGGIELAKKSPWLGYGTGDEIAMLKTEYARRGLFISYMQDYNAHNQYLSYLLKNGAAGLLLFLLVMGYYLWLGVRARHFLYISFVLLLLSAFYTENVLDANKGIFFFAFFNTLLGYRALGTLKQRAAAPEGT